MNDQALYQGTIPVFILYLSNLVRIIERAKKFATKNKISEKKLVEGRLAPDMYNFIQQIGYAYFMALETTTNLSDRKAPELSYNEKSFAELLKSLKKVIAFLKECPASSFRGVDRKCVVTFLDPETKYSADLYVRNLALPNFFFHVTTAYDILRHKGIPLGKDDYLGI